MTERINKFVEQFCTRISLDESLIVEREKRIFLLNEALKEIVQKDFFYAGVHLGKIKDESFLPSFDLLSMIAETKANKIVVDEKSEWLFICGRDLFKRGIVKIVGSRREGDYTLILNKHSECIGFGRIIHGMAYKSGGVVVKNMFDLGDFLRRERSEF